MKKILIIIGLYIIGVNILLSQPQPPCTMPCNPYVPWTYHQGVPVLMPQAGQCPTCTLYVDYWERECNSIIQLQMGSIQTSGDCAECLDFIPYYAFDWVVSHSSLVENKLNALHSADPFNRHCISDIEASRSTCIEWINTGGASGPSWHAQTCTTNICCHYVMEVCIDANGIIESPSYIIYDGQEYDCDGLQGSCINYCGTYSVRKSFNPEKINIEDLKKGSNYVTISPNPTKGNILMKFITKDFGEYKIIISNLTGKSIFEETVSVNSNGLQKEIDLGNSPDGIYLYKIIFDGKIMQSGKLNLVK